MTTWRATDLSVDPPSYEMGSADEETLAFDAAQPVTAVTARLVTLPGLVPASRATVTATLVGTVANVVVSGIARGETYELSVTFSAADGRRWTRTLVIVGVA